MGDIQRVESSMVGPRIPNMPMFEPSHDHAASSLMKQMDAAGVNIGAGEDENQFSFPADEAFWDNFTTQCQLNEWAVREPLYQVSSNHADDLHSVNQDWMRAFVGGWEKQNPHTVSVQASDGERQFFASEEFWGRVMPALSAGQAADASAVPGDGEVIVTRQAKGGAGTERVRCPTAAWEGACNNWERDKGCSREERQRQVAQRREEAKQFAQQSHAKATPPAAMWPDGISDSIPLPYLSLLPGQGKGAKKPTESELPDLDGSEVLFAADDNWWRALHAVSNGCPTDGDAVYIAEACGFPHGDVKQRSCTASRELMRRFVAAWNREYPCIVTIAVRVGKRLQSAAFAANDRVWQAVCAQASGRATPQLMRKIPDGCVLAHCSLDPTPTDMPVAVTAREWALAMKEFTNPDGWWDSWSLETDSFPSVQFRRLSDPPSGQPARAPRGGDGADARRSGGRTLSSANPLPGAGQRGGRTLSSVVANSPDATRAPSHRFVPNSRSPTWSSPDRQQTWARSRDQTEWAAARLEHYARLRAAASQPVAPTAATGPAPPLPAPAAAPPAHRPQTDAAYALFPPPRGGCGSPPAAAAPPALPPPAAPYSSPAPRALSPSHAVRIGEASRRASPAAQQPPFGAVPLAHHQLPVAPVVRPAAQWA